MAQNNMRNPTVGYMANYQHIASFIGHYIMAVQTVTADIKGNCISILPTYHPYYMCMREPQHCFYLHKRTIYKWLLDDLNRSSVMQLTTNWKYMLKCNNFRENVQLHCSVIL